MSEEYDVLAVRAQRAEAAETTPEPFVFRLGKKRYTWPAELPAGALELVGELQSVTDDLSPKAAAAMAKLLRVLSGAQAEELLSALSINDLAAMLPKYIEKVSGSGLGESSESPESSPDTPRPPRRTSSRRTGSTSSTTTAAA